MAGISTTTTTSCLCYNGAVVEVITAGLLTWLDCSNASQSNSFGIGPQVIGGCIKPNTWGGSAIVDEELTSYGSCCSTPTTTTTTTTIAPSLYIASTTGNACTTTGGTSLPTYVYAGTQTLCGCTSISGPNISGLALGTYYISDGINVREFQKTVSGASMTATGCCVSCSR